jgi:hypothetical protein
MDRISLEVLIDDSRHAAAAHFISKGRLVHQVPLIRDIEARRACVRDRCNVMSNQLREA